MSAPPPAFPIGRPFELSEVAAMPEFSLLRRSSLVAAWLAPYAPGLSANDEAAELPTSLSQLSPDAFRGAACLDTESRLSNRDMDFGDGDGGGGLNQGGSWDPGELAIDGASEVLGTRFLTLSSMRVPVQRDGPFIIGYIVTEVVLDRMSRHSYGLAFFPPLSRFALDTSTGQLTTVSARSDGQAVCWSGLSAAPPGQDGGGGFGGDAGCGGSGGGGNVYWVSSTFLRPSLGQRQPTLATRTSTLMKATVPRDKTVNLPPDWANVPPGPLSDFCRAMAGGATFGAASVSTEAPFGSSASSLSSSSEGGDPTGCLVGGGREGTGSEEAWPVTDGVFSMVTTVEPSSRSVLQRLCSLALTHVAVQPARMRLPPPAQAPPAGAHPLALRRASTASSMTVFGQRAGGGGGAQPASPSAFAASGGGSNGGGNSGSGAPSVCALASAVALAAPGAVTGSGSTHRRRRRQRVVLETVTDERVARRIVRNRKSAAAANERRRLERERERAREDAEDAAAAAAATAAAAAAAAVNATVAEEAGTS